MKNIAILASGGGTNAEAIVKHLENHRSLRVNLIACNKKNAFVLERAKKLKIPVFVFSKMDLESGELLRKLLILKIDYIILAGFLLKITENLIHSFPNKIINIHPALLPKYGGKGMYGEKVHKSVIENNEKESGITIHYVDKNFDEGKIIFQEKCSVTTVETPNSLAEKIHQLEHKYFPETIEKLWA